MGYHVICCAEGDPESVAGEYGRHSLYKMLGYFSLVGLLRLHSLLGDYYQAIKVLENIELNKKVKAHVSLLLIMKQTNMPQPVFSSFLVHVSSWFLGWSHERLFLVFQSMYSRVPECQITTYYYVGFAYLMMRRYQDAIRVFANILLYIQRTRNMFQRSTYKYEMVRERLNNKHLTFSFR